MERIRLAAWTQVSTDAVLSGLTLQTPAEAANEDSRCHGLEHPVSTNERLDWRSSRGASEVELLYLRV